MSNCNYNKQTANQRGKASVKKRVKKNLEEGRGFRLSETFGGSKGGTFEFASSNELWRASLDTIDFMPLPICNYNSTTIIYRS